MDRKVLGRMTVPIVAACFLLADCTGNTTTTPGPTTAFAVTRFTDAGALDTTFAAGRGVAITDINPGLFDFAVAVAVQPDNKIIAAGSSGFAGAGIIALVRYNADGTLDTTGFGTAGTGGIVTTPTPTGWTSASATTVAVQAADSKIVVAAVAFKPSSGDPSTGSTGIVLLRYNTDGKPDASFGTNGSAIVLPVGSGFPGDTCGLALQLDGKPVVVGATSDGKIVLARYTIAGVLDTTFGDMNSGITTTDLTVPAGDSNIGLSPSIGLQSGGQIIVASVAGRSSGPPANHVVLRYGTNGTLDTTFGAPAFAGIVTTDVAGGGNVDFPNALAVQANDKIVVVGHADVNVNAGFSDISLVRYNADGTLDTSFVGLPGNPKLPGIVTTDLGAFDGVFSIALQVQPGEPKIVVSGNRSTGGFAQLAVLRYNPDGSPDTSFDANGIASTPIVGPSNISSGNAVALQAVTGGFRIVVAGYD